MLDASFFESYLGMRVESVDMSEFTRRIEEGIFDPDEFEKACQWTRANCAEGQDYNPPAKQRTRAQKDQDWQTVVKMALIGRDLLVASPGNDILEGGAGRDAVTFGTAAAGVQVDLAAGTATGGFTAQLSAIEVVHGSAYRDRLTGDGLRNVLLGRAGNDVLRGAAGNDRLVGGDGDDALHGGRGDDLLDGGPGEDAAHGDDGTDTCLAEEFYDCEF